MEEVCEGYELEVGKGISCDLEVVVVVVEEVFGERDVFSDFVVGVGVC